MLLAVIATVFTCCNNNKKEKNSNTAKPEYIFNVPRNWTVEHIPFPIEFAPQIPFSGFEELRFPPGWEYTTSDQHWSYSFLWWLDNKPTIDATILQQYMGEYCAGLLGRNIKKRNIPEALVKPPIVIINKIETSPGDEATYDGIITMLDYLDITHKTINLNCVIHKKNCNYTALLFQISPKPATDTIWKQLNALNEGFRCKGE